MDESPRKTGRRLEGADAPATSQLDTLNSTIAPDHNDRALRTYSDQVSITFDWVVPKRAHTPITFQVRISRREQESFTTFVIDLDRLQPSDQETLHNPLHNLLAYPPKGYQLARSIAWILDVSLQQQQPSRSEEHRHAKVRELLLISHLEKSEKGSHEST